MDEKYYLILSLKWTHKRDECFTFWGKNSCGYQYNQSDIGVYSEDEANEIVNQDNNGHTKKIEYCFAEKMFTECKYYNEIVKVILNNQRNRNKLLIKSNHLLGPNKSLVDFKILNGNGI